MKNIALALQESVVLRFSILQGVQDFARTSPDWKLLRSEGSPVLSWEEAFASRPDGIIGFIGAEGLPSDPPLATPVVCVNSIHDCPNIARVRSDAVAVGALAARYFLGLGYRSFAYCTDVPSHYYSQNRSRGYRYALEDAGYTPRELILSSPRGDASGSELAELKLLPSKTALFCVTDACARRVLNYCEDQAIEVPRSLAVLGTDNDPFHCEGGRTLLSSIEVNHRKIGLQAAQLLSRILEGEAPPADAVLVAPGDVVVRASTELSLTAAHPVVARALAAIEQHFQIREFTVERIASACGVSSRTIGRLFRQQGMASPYQVLLNFRISAAKRLLEETPLTADEIAFKCGFADYSTFYRAFKNHVGIAPSAYR
ncbi:substrate-binding domain-containing protein [Lacipirellula sp.]|uniref:substrate-binding domain-containing protein n=1 Tax=Lacipirellula sp. TaxID=2691419 RepID=UPI003D136081